RRLPSLTSASGHSHFIVGHGLLQTYTGRAPAGEDVSRGSARPLIGGVAMYRPPTGSERPCPQVAQSGRSDAAPIVGGRTLPRTALTTGIRQHAGPVRQRPGFGAGVGPRPSTAHGVTAASDWGEW